MADLLPCCRVPEPRCSISPSDDETTIRGKSYRVEILFVRTVKVVQLLSCRDLPEPCGSTTYSDDETTVGGKCNRRVVCKVCKETAEVLNFFPTRNLP